MPQSLRVVMISIIRKFNNPVGVSLRTVIRRPGYGVWPFPVDGLPTPGSGFPSAPPPPPGDRRQEVWYDYCLTPNGTVFGVKKII